MASKRGRKAVESPEKAFCQACHENDVAYASHFACQIVEGVGGPCAAHGGSDLEPAGASPEPAEGVGRDTTEGVTGASIPTEKPSVVTFVHECEHCGGGHDPDEHPMSCRCINQCEVCDRCFWGMEGDFLSCPVERRNAEGGGNPESVGVPLGSIPRLSPSVFGPESFSLPSGVTLVDEQRVGLGTSSVVVRLESGDTWKGVGGWFLRYRMERTVRGEFLGKTFLWKSDEWASVYEVLPTVTLESFESLLGRLRGVSYRLLGVEAVSDGLGAAEGTRHPEDGWYPLPGDSGRSWGWALKLFDPAGRSRDEAVARGGTPFQAERLREAYELLYPDYPVFGEGVPSVAVSGDPRDGWYEVAGNQWALRLHVPGKASYRVAKVIRPGGSLMGFPSFDGEGRVIS